MVNRVSQGRLPSRLVLAQADNRKFRKFSLKLKIVTPWKRQLFRLWGRKRSKKEKNRREMGKVAFFDSAAVIRFEGGFFLPQWMSTALESRRDVGRSRRVVKKGPHEAGKSLQIRHKLEELPRSWRKSLWNEIKVIARLWERSPWKESSHAGKVVAKWEKVFLKLKRVTDRSQKSPREMGKVAVKLKSNLPL